MEKLIIDALLSNLKEMNGGKIDSDPSSVPVGLWQTQLRSTAGT
jgi:hypothetical protein